MSIVSVTLAMCWSINRSIGCCLTPTRRTYLRSLCEGLNMQYVDPGLVAQKVVQGMYNGVRD